MLREYCLTCHDGVERAGGLALDEADVGRVADNPALWERVVRKVRTGMMPPSGEPRPERAALDGLAAGLEQRLDEHARQHPNPGAVTLHRLNRAEYANAIRDLLSLDVDVAALLPADDSAEGFDNVADVLGVSPSLIQGYVSAAIKVSRLAVGDPSLAPARVVYRAPSRLAQDAHLEGLPLGTRGGLEFRHLFPLDAVYEFRVETGRRPLGGGALDLPDVSILLDGKPLDVADPSRFRLHLDAGPHDVAVALVDRHLSAGVDDVFAVFRTLGRVDSVAITGPLEPSGAGRTPSREKLFTCRPRSADEESACANEILVNVARHAFRRPIADAATDLADVFAAYRTAREHGDFETGIEHGVARVLVDPRFLFRFEREPSAVPDGTVYRISDVELASRLSFFLWSSLPDDRLIELAASGRLHEPAVLEQQVRRMLADPRAEALVRNFAGQWLRLRELDDAEPDTPEFDDNLRASFREETELLFASILREDRSVLDFLDADYTFVDERLARHYGIANVRGSYFRRVALAPDSPRRGLLGQGSILTVTSVADRTSPVVRGSWILENILAAPPPRPPPGVRTDLDTGPGATDSLRARLEAHRANPTCAACHRIMDPLGLALENFDLVGKWRDVDGGRPIDATGELVDGTPVAGPTQLRKALLSRPESFTTALTERLLTYALGRRVEYYDQPTIRRIARAAAHDDYRFSTIILGIASSAPFQMRLKGEGTDEG